LWLWRIVALLQIGIASPPGSKARSKSPIVGDGPRLTART